MLDHVVPGRLNPEQIIALRPSLDDDAVRVHELLLPRTLRWRDRGEG